MSICTKIAETPREIDDCYRLRHRVFVESDSRFSPTPDGRLLDRFDGFGNSRLFVAYENGKAVGTLRMSLNDPDVGLPADDYFDFAPHLPEGEITLAGTSQLCVDPGNRGSLQIINGLMMLAYYWSICHGITHAISPFNPALTRFMQRLGFKKIGEVCISNHYDLEIQPMLMQLDQIRDSFVDFLRRQQMVDFMESFFREYYKKDEHVIREGEEGEYAYFIIAGTARVETRAGGELRVLKPLKAGDFFGEISLLIHIQRTASIIAETPLELMVLSREQFLDTLEKKPGKTRYFLETIGKRIAASGIAPSGG